MEEFWIGAVKGRSRSHRAHAEDIDLTRLAIELGLNLVPINLCFVAKVVRPSALARIDPGLLAKNDPPVCCRHRWRRCSSRLREDRLAGFGARQGVREGTLGRCQLLFRSS